MSAIWSRCIQYQVQVIILDLKHEVLCSLPPKKPHSLHSSEGRFNLFFNIQKTASKFLVITGLFVQDKL